MTALVLSSLEWSATSTKQMLGPLRVARDEALARHAKPVPVLILLPIARRPLAKAIAPVSRVLKAVCALAKSLKVFLAGAVWARDPDVKATRVIAFLIDDRGTMQLRVPKLSPELLHGFGDEYCALGAPADFSVVRTPFGQIGLLTGEDILFASYARAAVFNGAELILNPSRERNDAHYAMRQAARIARAGENSVNVAVASSVRETSGRTELPAPPATAFYSFMGTVQAATPNGEFVYPDSDLDLLRRARVNPHKSFPAIVRAPVFARGYARANANKSQPPRTRVEWLREASRRLEREAQRHPLRQPRYEEQYEALLVQHCARLIPLDRTVDAAALIERNLDEALALAGSRANVPSVRLVVFPEFWLTGPGGIGAVLRSVEDMERLAISYPGHVFDRIAAFAQANKVYVAFQNFELHPKFPHRVFNSAFLMDDAGNLLHTYRKNQCADVWGLLPDTTPGSILSRYLDVLGEDALFPVADTPLGRLANMICFDNMIPEVTQGLRRAGAEIILHSTSEPHGGAGREVWDTVRRMRAFENCCYFLSAVDGGEHLTHDSDTLTFFRRGHSKIVRFDGRVEGVVDGPGPVAFRVNIDLAALRRARADANVNLGLWDEPAVYRKHYGADVGLPNDLWSGDPKVNPYSGAKQLQARIATYLQRGIYVAPSAPMTRASIPDSV